MRKFTLPVALVGAIFATAVAFPSLADAMTFNAAAGVLNAAVTVDLAQPEQVYWRRYRPRTYYYGYYQPWPYAAYYYPYGYNYYYYDPY